MLLPFVTGPAKVDHRRLTQKENIVRGVCEMALGTISFFYRRMRDPDDFLFFPGLRQLPFDRGYFLLLFHGVGMTFSAEAL